MATAEKKRNLVQGMEVPGWVTGYHKWEATPLWIVAFFLPCLVVWMITICIATVKFPTFAKDESIYSLIVSLSPGLVVGTIVGFIYGWNGMSKRKAARAYAKAELIVILGVKEDHYCKAAVELGLAHLVHVISILSCNPDLLSGAYAKARALARLEFDFLVPDQGSEKDILDKTYLVNAHPLNPALLQGNPALDNSWINIARCLGDSQKTQTAPNAV